jgi:prepilin-type processing-associated H-X9-DG protein
MSDAHFAIHDYLYTSGEITLIDGNGNPRDVDRPIRLSRVQNPAGKLMYVDYGQGDAANHITTPFGYSSLAPHPFQYLPGGGMCEGGMASGYGSLYDPYLADFQQGRHRGGVNYTCADGHVEWGSGKDVGEQFYVRTGRDDFGPLFRHWD